MMPTKKYKGEDTVMCLLKSSEYPILDVIDFNIQQERKAAAVSKLAPLDTLHVNSQVWAALRAEVYKCKENFAVADSQLAFRSYGIEFNGMKLVPFFSTPSAEEAMPSASMLMYYRKGRMYGL